MIAENKPMAAESPYLWATRVARLGEREIVAFMCTDPWCGPVPHEAIVAISPPGFFAKHDECFATWAEAEAWLREGS
jgi:hypothetical protein